MSDCPPGLVACWDLGAVTAPHPPGTAYGVRADEGGPHLLLRFCGADRIRRCRDAAPRRPGNSPLLRWIHVSKLGCPYQKVQRDSLPRTDLKGMF